MRSLCTEEIPNWKQAAKISKQLNKNPEMCEKCQLKECTYALSIAGGQR